MDRTWIRTRWNELQTAMLTRWERLNQTDLDQIDGDWDLLVAQLQHKYNASRTQAEREIDRFLEAAKTSNVDSVI